jgi:succinylglutamate desuccinylase
MQAKMLRQTLAQAPLAREILRAGPRGGGLCVLTAGVHGNEPGGVLALRRVVASLSVARLRGRVAMLVGNLAGLERDVRFLHDDLNRLWRAEDVHLARRGEARGSSERAEQQALLALLDEELAQCGSATLLDLHSTSSLGPPFTVVSGPSGSSELALAFKVPLLSGIEGLIGGTLIEWFGALCHRSIVLEGGQNAAASTVDHHEAAAWIALIEAGVVAPSDAPARAALEARLAAGAQGLPAVVEVGYCHHLQPGEDFEMLPGFRNFDPVREGQLLARSGPQLAREVRAPWSGTLIMPRYQGQGLDGFFLGRAVG